MSHEIRTPLGAVIGLNELLAGTNLNSEQEAYVENIGQSAEILLNLVNDVLDLSKLDSGKLQLHLEPTSINEMSKGIVNIFKEKALERSIELRSHIAASSPKAVEVDAVRLKQVLINLCSNAIKFTYHGKVDINFSYSESVKQLEIAVEDTGIGMSENQLKYVFDEFIQADTSTTKEYGGTGLGLPICKKIVGAMDGTLEVESKKGKGSIFKLSIPAQECPEPTDSVGIKQMSVEGMRSSTKLLLAEDFHLNQTIFTKMMGEYGVNVKTVDNGLRALREAEKTDYDLIFLDIQMPIMDGIEACKNIRKLSSKKRPWIVALTANAFSEYVEKYGKSGFDDYVAKPFTRRSLQLALSNFIAGKGRYRGSSAKTNQAPKSNNLLNLEVLEDNYEMGLEFKGKFMTLFHSSINECIDDIDQGIAAKDKELTERAAHSAKGICLRFGMDQCGDQLHEIEALAKNADWEQASQVRRTIKTTLQESIKALEEFTKKRGKDKNGAA